MKKILGLDLGSNSIGWALVNEADDSNSKIIKLGVRSIKYENFVSTESGSESKDPNKDFLSGRGISPNAGRTKARSARRNLQRYKLRRENLIQCLIENKIISENDILTETGNKSTYNTYKYRALAVIEKIELIDLARVLLQINKKRGYKSCRKDRQNNDEQVINSIDLARELYDNNETVGQYVYKLLQSGNKSIPNFYRSDYQNEFDKIWAIQKQYYPEILNDDLYNQLKNKNIKQTWAICSKPFNIIGIKRDKKAHELKIENYRFRKDALSLKMDLETLAIVLQEINGQLNSSSGYLGDISDRSKQLYINNITVGQYIYNKLQSEPHYSTKKQIFYRQDYLDEFERIWQHQAQYYSILTPELKATIRDIIIFYQRKLKSQKGLVGYCELESKKIEFVKNGITLHKINGCKVCPKSSPIFQEFRIWQNINSITVTDLSSQLSRKEMTRELSLQEKKKLFNELSTKEKLLNKQVCDLLFPKNKFIKLNFEKIEGNRTQSNLFKSYQKIIVLSGHNEYNFEKIETNEALEIVTKIFNILEINTEILDFNSELKGNEYFHQGLFKLWELLYSSEEDDSKLGNEKLIINLCKKFNLTKEYAAIIANTKLEDDYANLSTCAMRKILPFLKQGYKYSEACKLAGYNHSTRSLTKEQINNKVLKNKLDLLAKNSLRNPVVEKILNQMINVVNEICNEYGKPDEIRIELARELKQSADERSKDSKRINNATKSNEEIKKKLHKDFGFNHISNNDIIRYRLYEELAQNGYKTLYSNTYIPYLQLFSKDFDVEHILPQAKAFDNSFSDKTLELRSVNQIKGKMTAYDFIEQHYGKNELERYLNTIKSLKEQGCISNTKFNKLRMSESDIPSNFIERELKDTQYISKKAREILEDIVSVVTPTTGSITAKLRDDWQLVNIMRDLNWSKYERLELTETIEGRDKQKIKRIKDWSKRNDHRHHAMDALTVAFTKQKYIKYLNDLSAKIGKEKLAETVFSDKEIKHSDEIYSIEREYLHRDDKNKLRFNCPMPIETFRKEAKYHLNNILISFKANNKVVTKNKNIIKTTNGETLEKLQLTPRGSLHNDTIYGMIKKPYLKKEKIGAGFNIEKINTVTSTLYRELLTNRLNEFNGDAKKAFTGKNALEKNPIYIDKENNKVIPIEVKTLTYQTFYTIRKEINHELNIEKVVDKNIKELLINRLNEYNKDPKKAFNNIGENPIYLNKSKGIRIKRVTIYGPSAVEPIHYKKDHLGNFILDHNGEQISSDYVQTSNNHHVAIYKDENSKLQERIVSFFETTKRANKGQAIVDKNYNNVKQWQFMFTLKQNEYFVFPRYEFIRTNEKNEKETTIYFSNPLESIKDFDENNGDKIIKIFDPKDIDLTDESNYNIISPNLYRVQKLSSGDYVFRHHLETTVETNNKLKNITWIRCGLSKIENIVKVRINNIGKIVDIGEY